MQTPAHAFAGFAIPPRPDRVRSPRFRRAPVRRPVLSQSAVADGWEAALRWWRGLGPVQEASLVGSVGLLSCWGIAEVALLLGGF